MTAIDSLLNAVFPLAIWVGGVAAMLLGMIAIVQNLMSFTVESVLMCAGGLLMFLGGTCLVSMAASIVNDTFKAVQLLEGK